jgi:hypothetical protein
MARVISIHEYELRRDADGAAFERALRDADMRGRFDLTGLVELHFLRGFKGARQRAYTAVWIFESREGPRKKKAKSPEPVESAGETVH